MNCVILCGRTTTDIDLRTTTSGKNVTSFALAVDRPGANDKTDFIPIVAWEKTAEFLNKYIGKGRKIIVEGFLSSRKYEDKNGNSRVAYEVVANRVEFADGKPVTQTAAELPKDIEEIDGDEDLPF